MTGALVVDQRPRHSAQPVSRSHSFGVSSEESCSLPNAAFATGTRTPKGPRWPQDTARIDTHARSAAEECTELGMRVRLCAIMRPIRRRVRRSSMTRREIRVRRVYDRSEPDAGVRVLVDRVWPRGLRKDGANLDEWGQGCCAVH